MVYDKCLIYHWICPINVLSILQVNWGLKGFGSDPNKYRLCFSSVFFKKENATQQNIVYFVGQTKWVLKKMTGACKKLLVFSGSRINYLNAYDQEGNHPVSSIYIGYQFHNH